MARTWPRDRRPAAILLAGAIAMTIQALVIPRLDLRTDAEKAPKPYRLLRLDPEARAELRECLDAGRDYDACFAQIGYEPMVDVIYRSGSRP
ncbi:MAG TPA: hypothetical protein VNQ77_00655 [Frankiaceae bacterium]|nr:hypothetical protein [Frankiaceae bacterium]